MALNINKFEEECVSDEVIDQDYGTREICVCPLCLVWIGYVETSNRGVNHLLGGLGDHALDFLLVVGT